jgi:molecular chaperone GrpE
MPDDNHEIPVKVVDRRWWARGEDEPGDTPSLKPTYVEELERQVTEKDTLLQSYVAKYREAAKEFDDARIRLRREVSKDVERGRREMLADLLEVVDNLDRAIEAGREAAGGTPLLQGVELVRQQFLAKLQNVGVSRLAAEGQQFDPLQHEAVSIVPASSPEADGCIVGVVREGYGIGEDVLRPALVAVAKYEARPAALGEPQAVPSADANG